MLQLIAKSLDKQVRQWIIMWKANLGEDANLPNLSAALEKRGDSEACIARLRRRNHRHDQRQLETKGDEESQQTLPNTHLLKRGAMHEPQVHNNITFPLTDIISSHRSRLQAELLLTSLANRMS